MNQVDTTTILAAKSDMNLDASQLNDSKLIALAESHGGMGVFAASDLPKGLKVSRFEGVTCSAAKVPSDEWPYVFRLGEAEFLIPSSPSRFFNHSCEPNCEIDDDLFIVTSQPIARGEQLTFAYNVLSQREGEKWNSLWQANWTFSCQCGSSQCQLNIDRYLVELGKVDGHLLSESVTLANDVSSLVQLARDIGTFTDEEIDCLQNDLFEYLQELKDGNSEDIVLTLRIGREIVGLRFSGPLPMTDRSWMLFWILVAPAYQGKGLGRLMLSLVSDQVQMHDGRLLLIETSDSAAFAPARSVYEKSGFKQVAHLEDFYEEGQGKCIFGRKF